MAVNTGLSKSLFVNTNANVDNHIEETSTMLLLLNAIEEVKNRNIKKAIVEFNQSFIESKENGELFSSKLLELSYPDLEILFLCLCGAEKNRRSSKQYDKRCLKKKSSVGDLSFSNSAFEIDQKSTYISNSLGRKGGHVLIQEENKRNCLRKVFYLRRDFKKPDLHTECFQTILNLHLKVENYYPCVLLFIGEEMKLYHEHLICTLDDSQKFKIYQLCIFVASNVSEKQTTPTKHEIKLCIEHCRLACKLLPNEEKPHELLCKIHRKAGEIENALAVISTYFDEVNINSVPMLLQKLFCLVDLNEADDALTIACKVLSTRSTTQDLTVIELMRAYLLILRTDTAAGLNLFQTYTIDNNKATVISVLCQFNCAHLQIILNELKSYLQNIADNENTNRCNEIESEINLDEIKNLLMLTAQLIAVKNPGDLSFSKQYIDSLCFCGENELAQTCLVRLVKEHSTERLPMIYLANLRLKLGAYVAATEDFRTLYMMWGFDDLSKNLFTLPLEDRKEIARVHRLHGFRYLRNDDGFKESAECFSVALCAIGLDATGLLLSRGLCYMHLNDFEKAGDDFNRCLERDTTISAAICARAVLYAATTHVEESILNFRRAFTIDPNACQQCLTKLPLEHVLTFAQLISQYIKQELWNVIEVKKNKFDEISEMHENELINAVFDKEMLRYSEFLCKVFPTNTDHVSTYIQCLYISKEYSASLHETNNAINLFPNEHGFHAWKGVLFIRQRKFEDAINEMKEIKKGSDEIASILSNVDRRSQLKLVDKVLRKASSLYETKQYGEAISFYNIAILTNNKDIDALRGRLECYSKIGESKKWLQNLSKVIQLQPLTVDLCQRAKYYQMQGDDIRACEDYIYALEIEEEQTVENVTVNSNGEQIVELFHSCAWCMVELEKSREALRLCEAGLKFDPMHRGLRLLKEKTKSHANKCVIQ